MTTADQPATIQVAYQASDRLIVALGPFDPGSDFGPDYPIATLDASQQSLVLAYDTPYLCADGARVGPEPC